MEPVLSIPFGTFISLFVLVWGGEAGANRNLCDQPHRWTSVCFGEPGAICRIIRIARPARLGSSAHARGRPPGFRKPPQAAPQLLAWESQL